MFQKSILRNFVKAFSISGYEKLKKLCCQKNKIDEDANGAEFLLYLAKFLDWKNYTREVKNKLDMKKADGVVYNNENQPIAIIELKSSDKQISNRDIIEQAFRYKNEKPTCKYVIISNFKELNIFCQSSDVSFDIDMTKDESYKTLYALLNEHSLENNEISRLKKISKTQEEITKEVYKEYSNFRLKLLINLVQNNEKISKEVIFESANKLLDRFMFILFAEDRGLIPANSIDAIIKQYENAHEWGEDTLLYEYYKKYFYFIDVGNAKVKIPKYNGNLFKPDAQLENLIIDDEIIKADLSHLSAYDFSDDVDVEVLGHIFEQSLNDLEKIKESLFVEHKIVDTRKKDGVFYTPKFITEYIINNTIAKLCDDKKEDLKLYEVIKDTKKAKEKRRNTLHNYREYLENLKIVDPACGSGAFLTASFRYLLQEHKWIQNELGKAGAGLFNFHDIDKQIIEKNLFGVDINGASVGIAKLSLWLQTAKRDRPLSNLMQNIKSANSLTADWSELFPEIMADGGFDCVVGNPPYVRQESIKELKPALKEIYSVFTGTADLFVYFYELAQNILKTDGLNGFICSNKFYNAKYGKNLRNMILTKTTIKSIVDFNGVQVFEDATVDSTITILKKGFSENNIFQISLKDYKHFFDMQQNDLSTENFTFLGKRELDLKKKLEKNGTVLKDWDIDIKSGIKTGFNEAFIIDGAKKDELIKEDKKSAEIIKPLLRGRDIKQYSYEFADKWIIATKLDSHEYLEEKYPIIFEYLVQYQNKLANRGQCKNRGGKGQHHWLELDNNPTDKYFQEFEKEKILWIELSDLGKFTLDTQGYYAEMTVFFIAGENLKYLLALLNSKTVFWYFDLICAESGVGTNRWKKTYVNQLPIPKITKEEQKPFINLVNSIIDSKEKIAKYKKYFESLSAVDKIEIKEEIEKLETLVLSSVNEIDRLVYGLYGLNGDEIKIIEEDNGK